MKDYLLPLLLSLAKKRLYISTTLHEENKNKNNESLQEKNHTNVNKENKTKFLK